MNALTRMKTVFAGLGLQGGRVAARHYGNLPIPPHRAVLPGSHAGRRLRRRVYHGPYVAVGPAETVVLNVIQDPGLDHDLNIEVPAQARANGTPR